MLETAEVSTVWKPELRYPGEGLLPLQVLSRNLSVPLPNICWLLETLSLLLKMYHLDLCSLSQGLWVCARVLRGLPVKTPVIRPLSLQFGLNNT